MKFRTVLAYTFGSAAVLGGAALLFISKTERGFKTFLDLLYDREFPDVPVVDPETLAVDLNGATPPLLIDARTPEEYAVSHLRNAQFVNAELFSVDDVDDIDRDRSIVVYCSVGARSGRIARQLRDLGFADVRNLYGGIFLWYNQGRPLYRDGSVIDEVHPYNKVWGQFITRGRKSIEPRSFE